MNFLPEYINLIKSIFRGRQDVYASRWEKDKPPVIFDYRDSKIDYFDKMFKQRNRYYNKLLK